MIREPHPVLAERRAIVVGDDELGVGIAARLTQAGALVRLVGCGGTSEPIGPALRATVTELGGIDILIVNVLPEAHPAALDATSMHTLDAALARVAIAWEAMQEAFLPLRAQGGRIIIIGHRYGETINEGLAAYNAAAWALVGLTRSAAVDWGQHQITTNMVLPLAVTSELRAALERRPRVLELLLSQLPLRRAGDPVEDIGGAVVFLASDDAGFINGEIVHADGGQHVAGPVLNPIRFAAP
jgi:3-oxoacyl-[acyl-carrier protein] reductase